MIKISSILAIITCTTTANLIAQEKINTQDNQGALLSLPSKNETVLKQETDATIDVVSVLPEEEEVLLKRIALAREVEEARSQPFSDATRHLMRRLKAQNDHIYFALLWHQFKKYIKAEKKLPLKKRKYTYFPRNTTTNMSSSAKLKAKIQRIPIKAKRYITQ
ncbi:hypothetical protein [Candidatus Odyssella acanthamoebae]|uniref:Uncharacterized protein n=1 Tax=Candidatus Odyssella acanthamoebae TaxID=91604 RepID=A0A077AZ61_9PROT|nr:hypothetical protein [Candidatus Paracaedibacter acanthamoebae]AIK96015.1 hypothetical protein ID47_03560 [Candidatus Paracaedibacter acanthamoebae]